MKVVPVIVMALALVTADRRAGAETPPALLCVRQAQADLKACRLLARSAGDQCKTTYSSAVPPCFGANASCASDCVSTWTNCESVPRGRQTSCASACDQEAKSSLTACRTRPGRTAETCQLTSKFQSLKCKQKCARATAVPLERCGLDFGSCLKSCATQGP